MAANEEEIWDKDRLTDASQEELVARILELQEQLQRVDQEVTDLRRSIQFILDVQAGIKEPGELLNEENPVPDTDSD